MHYVFENYFSEDEVKDILEELDSLRPSLEAPENTGTARSVLGVPKKSNRGIFLTHPNSGILRLMRKTFSPEVKIQLNKAHWFFKYIEKTNHDSTLVSYYRKGDYYKEHSDESLVTAIYYVWREPKSFEGGDIIIDGQTVHIKNNSLLVFPSTLKHKVSEITEGEGRWSISQFIDQRNPLDKIKNFSNFLHVSEFNKLTKNIFNSKKWSFIGSSHGGEQESKFWHLSLSDEQFFTEFLFDRICSLTGLKLELERVYANGQSMGQNGSFHQDSERPGSFTFLLFVNEIEDIDEWGGETQFKIGQHQIISYQPVPNTALFFPSRMFHRGLAPRKNTLRVTIAWKCKIFSNEI